MGDQRGARRCRARCGRGVVKWGEGQRGVDAALRELRVLVCAQPQHTHTHEPTPFPVDPHPRAPSRLSTHSRTTSLTSLLPPLSLSPSPRGLFAALRTKLSALSLTKSYDYEIGTSKGKDYERARVRNASPEQRQRQAWKIDGGGPGGTPVSARPGPGSGFGSGVMSSTEDGTEEEGKEERDPPVQRDSLARHNLSLEHALTLDRAPSSLPSVLDIRGPGPPRSYVSRTNTRTHTQAETVDSEMYVPEEDLWAGSEVGGIMSQRSNSLSLPRTSEFSFAITRWARR